MKTIAGAVIGLGVVTLVAALIPRMMGYHQFMGANVSSGIRGAIALYLLAMAIMMFDKLYGVTAAQHKP